MLHVCCHNLAHIPAACHAAFCSVGQQVTIALQQQDAAAFDGERLALGWALQKLLCVAPGLQHTESTAASAVRRRYCRASDQVRQTSPLVKVLPLASPQ